MSEYHLYFTTDTKPKEVLDSLRPLLSDPKKEVKSENNANAAGRPWVWIWDGPVQLTASQARPEEIEIVEEFGVRPNISIHLELFFYLWEDDVEVEQEDPHPIMIRDVLALLDRFPGDAILLNCQWTEVILRRLAKKLELNLSWSNWTAELLALITMPHEERRFEDEPPTGG